MSSFVGTFSTSGSETHHDASAKAMRRLSIIAWRYSVELCWSSVNLGILLLRSSSSRMPSAINATMPCPFGGCSQISTPWLWPSCTPWACRWTISWPVNLREIGSTSWLPTSAWFLRSSRVRYPPRSCITLTISSAMRPS